MINLFRKCLSITLAAIPWIIQMTTFFLNLTVKIPMLQQVTHLTLLNMRMKVRIRLSIDLIRIFKLILEIDGKLGYFWTRLLTFFSGRERGGGLYRNRLERIHELT